VSYHYHDDPVEETAVRSILPKFIAACLLMIFSFVYYQTTLAANINLNSGRSVEFGQSVSITAPCAGSDNLTVTPKSSFVNASSGGGDYYLNSVKVAGIPASCNGKDFSLSFFDSVTGSSALPIFSFFGENKRVATVFNSAGYFLNGFQSSGTEVSSASGTFTVTFTTPVAFSTNATKVTLQTTEHKDWAEASISSGAFHTCTLLNSSRVKCWGWGFKGQIGDGGISDRNAATDLQYLPSGFTSIATGYEHSCAVFDTGQVNCWGTNGEGQLGVGTNNPHYAPATLPNGSGVRAIASGWYHTCALLRTGGVKCWGRNNEGQLGNNTTTTSNAPIDVSGLSSGVIQISGGAYHTCAVLSTGAVECWGKNTSAQLGTGFINSQSNIPVAVRNMTNAVAVATGISHSCAVLDTGAAKCWGLNTSGQLGTGNVLPYYEPEVVSGINNVVAISAGGNSSCAVLSSGAAKCWGSSDFGQVGDGGTSQRNSPTDVSGLSSGVRAITTGLEHSCALLGTGAARCWGNNTSGRLGNGVAGNSSTPVIVTGIP
jgi:alpha-tubulin suppressor-like RCC1 family protein